MKVCGNPDSGLLVIQALDARELERLEDEVKALQSMGGALPLWAAFAVEDWNDALSHRPFLANMALQGRRRKRLRTSKSR